VRGELALGLTHGDRRMRQGRKGLREDSERGGRRGATLVKRRLMGEICTYLYAFRRERERRTAVCEGERGLEYVYEDKWRMWVECAMISNARIRP